MNKHHLLIKKIYFILFLFFLTSLGLFFYQMVRRLQINEFEHDNILMLLDKFTWQSNMLLLVFTIFYCFFPEHSFMKNNKFFFALMTYISFTFFGYNVILNIFSTFGYGRLSGYKLFESIWLHAFCPLIFLVVGIFKMYVEKPISLPDFWPTLLKTMIYPTFYCLYLILIPYLYNSHSDFTYSIYGKPTNTKDYPEFAFPAIFSIYFVFFPSMFCLYYFLQKKIIYKNNL